MLVPLPITQDNMPVAPHPCTNRSRLTRRAALGLLAAGAATLTLGSRKSSAAQPAGAPGRTTAWVPAHNGRARLIATRLRDAPYAGIEIALDDGWKTYWRNPGDAGGIPPELDWSGSDNLASASLAFPAPVRLTDSAGDTIGYKKGVVLPIRLTAKAPGPIDLKLALNYGICREICIPAEASFTLDIPATGPSNDPADPVAAALAAALASVPSAPGASRPADPRLIEAHVRKGERGPVLEFLVDAAGADPASVDLFAEGPDGSYVPQPRRSRATSGTRVPFELALSDAAELADLKGKPIRLTLVSATGAAEMLYQVP